MTDEQAIDLAHAVALTAAAVVDAEVHGELIGTVEGTVATHLLPAVYAVLPDPS